jgi:hypothetical protein
MADMAKIISVTEIVHIEVFYRRQRSHTAPG